MSLELINTLAAVATTAIIAATAITAMVQLRHLRANNQIGIQLAIHKTFIDRDFWKAIGLARFEMPRMIADPVFPEFMRRYHKAREEPGDERFEEAYEAVLLGGRSFE